MGRLLNEKETDYAKIWARLMESFGNSRLMLQNNGLISRHGGVKVLVHLSSICIYLVRQAQMHGKINSYNFWKGKLSIKMHKDGPSKAIGHITA